MGINLALRSSLRLPESLHEEVKLLEKNEWISINQFITSAVAEKMSALLIEEYFVHRAKQGNEKLFFETMSKMPDVEAEEKDRV